MQLANALTFDEHRLVSLWHRPVMTLGIHTARVVLARAIWQTAQRHPDIALIRHDDGYPGAASRSTASSPPGNPLGLCVWLTLVRLFWRKQLLGRVLGEHDTA
jgi:hypothetical protein